MSGKKGFKNLKKNINALSKYKIVGIDTNIFIYHFHDIDPYTKFTDKIFSGLAENKLRAITSLITLTELLSHEFSDSTLKALRESFFTVPNLQVMDFDKNVALEAARIRREYKYRLPDAVQLATAMYGKAQVFITNDDRLKKFKELKVIMLKRI